MASKFIEEIRRHMRMRGYSLKTEKAYIYWIKYFIRFNMLKHPQDMGTTEVTAYLSYLANEQHVAINTQKVALNAIAFLYNQFLQRPLGDLGFTYAKKQRKVPCSASRISTTRFKKRFLIFSSSNSFSRRFIFCAGDSLGLGDWLMTFILGFCAQFILPCFRSQVKTVERPWIP
ncbi:hypothetical protein F7Q91_24065 [Vibrio chagasii]|uniref:Core-binding (CB) domain-containing protein n=1 Tax=Vibrio chagasii TaxID=170679 RepID=A0A7V7TE91_9VIBR|nr:hypothetical protein F7Q91_24065 [Vibrio chagasii]